MSTDDSPRRLCPGEPGRPIDADLQHEELRQRLARLLGRLLARHWLRSQQPPALPDQGRGSQPSPGKHPTDEGLAGAGGPKQGAP